MKRVDRTVDRTGQDRESGKQEMSKIRKERKDKRK